MNLLYRVLGYVAPATALRRARHRAAMAALDRSYEGARVGRRTEGWVVAGSSANAEIGTALSRLRDRSRDLVRNNPYAGKAVQAVVSNLIGTGILPRARSGDTAVNETTTSCGPASPRPATRTADRLLRSAGADRPRHGGERRVPGAHP